MSKWVKWLMIIPCASLGPVPRAVAAEPVKPIRALLVAGGCCHDYEHQKDILTRGISGRANIQWTIAYDPDKTTGHKNPVYDNPNWADGFDVVVHDECSSAVNSMDVIETVLRPHKGGLPGVVLHCGMHSYRTEGWNKKVATPWMQFTGLISTGHGKQLPIAVTYVDKDHPITKPLSDWTTINEELYNNASGKIEPTAHALARGKQGNDDYVVAWTNTYNGTTKVFSTTLGHNNATVDDPRYLDLVTRGLLWSVGKLDAEHLKAAEKPAKIEKKKELGPENLAAGKPAKASTTQGENRAEAATDGNSETRWCAANGDTPQWLQVDLGKAEDLAGCRVTWEFEGKHYRYKIEGSADGMAWSMLSDQTKSHSEDQSREHTFNAKGVRYVRLTATDLDDGGWASIYEFEVLGTKMVAPTAAQAHSRLPRDSAEKLLAGVKVPAGFDLTLFAGPKEVHYPTCLAAAPTGEVFVGIDENGSLDRKEGRGRVVRCIDDDGDGKADRFNVFATMDSPRGLIWDDGTLYVLHPPNLTAYHDDNRDGVADRSEDLVKGIGFDLKFRGADHTTNGIRLGIDGWIYIAVGDYGYIKAEGHDGTTLQLRGGGVSRVRLDGSGLEIYSRGQRNIYDVAVDPYLNVFTRDNTNDGGGWDVRLSQIIPTGHYGYPSLFVNFPDEIVPPLADYGGGSPTGSLYLQEPGLPPDYGDTLYTCEWGRSAVFRHPLEPDGAGFKAKQESFVELPRPTDMDVDGRSRIYISTWRDGGFTYSKPDVGYVIRLTAKGSSRPPFPDLKKATEGELLQHLAADSQVLRQTAQREILRRGDQPRLAGALTILALSDKPLAARVAAIFTLAQLGGHTTHTPLLQIAAHADVREFALQALADRRSDADVPATPFMQALSDGNARARLQAVVGLARLGKREASIAILPLIADSDRLVAHAAVKALVALDASDVCLATLYSANTWLIPGCVQVLQSLHDAKTVDGLIKTLDKTNNDAVRRGCLKALCRLYYQEAEYTGDWWTTRPDTSGPYYKTALWDQSEKIRTVLRKALDESDSGTSRWLLAELIRNKIEFEDTTTKALKIAGEDPSFRSTLVDLLRSRPALPAEAIVFLDGVASSDQTDPVVRSKALRVLQKNASTPRARDALIHGLATIAVLDKPNNDLLGVWKDFVNDGRNARDLKTFVKLAEAPEPGVRLLADAVLLQIEGNAKSSSEAKSEARQAIDRAWSRPEAAASLLGAIGLTRAEKYAHQVRTLAKDADPDVRKAASETARRLDLDRPTSSGPTIAKLPFDRVVADVVSGGDADLGGRLFERQGCVSCHTVSKSEGLKGPFLGDVSTRYSRKELAESILKPSAKISQGFETQRFATTSGQVIEGFVVRESGEEVELRNAAGVVTVLPKSDIDERGKSETSVMPVGLVDQLTVPDLASILAYLESLKAK